MCFPGRILPEGQVMKKLCIFAVLALVQVELTHVQVSFSVSFPNWLVVSNMFYFPYSYGHLPVISGCTFYKWGYKYL